MFYSKEGILFKELCTCKRPRFSPFRNPRTAGTDKGYSCSARVILGVALAAPQRTNISQLTVYSSVVTLYASTFNTKIILYALRMHIHVLNGSQKNKTGSVRIYVTLRCFSVITVAALHILRVCLYVHSTQSACAVLSSVACPAVQHFSTLSHKRHDFRKKKILNTKCFSIFSINLVRHISRSTRNPGRYDQKCISVFM